MQTVVSSLRTPGQAPDFRGWQLIELRDLTDPHVHQVICLTHGRGALGRARVAGGGLELGALLELHPLPLQ